MSTAGGPKLHGIGRSGDSDIVLCVDAHDAGSYPGQPTTNYISSVTGWPGSAGVGYATPITLGEFGQLRNLAPIFDTYGLVPYTLSMEMKGNISGSVLVYMQNGSYTKYGFVSLSVNVTTEYQRFVFSNLTPNGPTAAWTANTPTDERAMLACYTGYGSGRNPTVKNIQLELGAYATPFVESRLPDPYAQGYSARPTSVNLMIHGDVGTGQTFSDSSPSKHTITTVGNTTHSSAESKFSGGSIYFDGSGDRLSVSSHADFGFGTGSFTVDCWVYKIATVAWETFVDTYSYVNNGFICGLKDSNSTIAFYSEGGTGWNYAGGTALALNTWYHLAWVRDGNNFRMFVNGTQQGSTFTFSSSDNYAAGQLIIGSRASAQYINGYMDEVRVTKGTALWTQSFTPPTRRNRNAPVVDLSGSNKGGNLFTTDMTDVATYRDGQVIEPVASAVWDFDGTDDYMRGGPLSGQVGSTTTKTYEYWFKMSSGFGSGVLSMQSTDTNSYNWQYVYVHSNGSLQFHYGPTNAATYNLYGGTAASVITADVWTCIAISIDVSRATATDRVQIYKNGEAQTVSWNGTYTNKNAFYDGSDLRLYIGAWNHSNPPSPSTFLNGQMGKVSIWKTGLTAQQVKQNFNSQRSRFKV